MTKRINYGQYSNGNVCSCKNHCGVGHMSPEDRAAAYARMRDRMRSLMSQEQREFLESWENAHGKVVWELVDIGLKSSGEFGASKGDPVLVPKMVGSFPLRLTERRPPARAWADD